VFVAAVRHHITKPSGAARVDSGGFSHGVVIWSLTPARCIGYHIGIDDALSLADERRERPPLVVA
jgi:hypothetical protein